MHGLTLEWKKCPDGVELIDLGPPQKGDTLITGERGGKRARYRTEHRSDVQYDISDLENPIVLRFVNAQDDEARVQFLSTFGLTGGALFENHPIEMDWENVEKSHEEFKKLLVLIDGTSPVQTVKIINSAMANYKGFALTPHLDLAGAKGAPRLTFRPQSLLAFMLMEVALIVANGARTTACKHCEKLFVTGPLTGRRSHAKFCSDRCRVAAMRQRHADKAKRGAT